jgi:rhamnulose-1-phosphate aldolase
MQVKLTQEGTSYQVLWGGNDGVGQPTMEFIPHLKVQASLRLRDVPSRVVLHTHPRHIIAMTHLPEYRDPDFDRVLQTSQSTARVFLGEGVGMTQYMPMGSEQLADPHGATAVRPPGGDLGAARVRGRGTRCL